MNAGLHPRLPYQMGAAAKRYIPAPYRFGHALALDGVNDFASATMGTGPGQFPTTYPARFSISFWYRNEAPVPTGNAAMFVWGNAGGAGSGFFAIASQSTGWFLRFSTANVFIEPHSQGSWRHLVLVCDTPAETVHVYANGALAATSPWAGVVGTTFQLGKWIHHFQGQLDEFAIWERAVLPSEIRTLYNGGNGYDARALSFGSLLCYYPFNDMANPGADLSPHGRNLWLQNGATLAPHV